MLQFDDLVHQTGECGTFQRRLLALVIFICIISGYNTSLSIFLLTIPAHRCALDNVLNDTYDVQDDHHAALINRSIPLDDGSWSKCSILREDANQQLVEQDCDRWVYDHGYFDRSVIEELNIVCDKKPWRAHGNMAMMIGKLASSVVQGFCSDAFGRRKTLLGFIVIMVGSTFAQAFIFNLASLIAFRFMAGLATTSTYLNALVIALEFVGPSYRQTASVLVAQGWVIGGFVLVGVAYVLRDFQDLGLALGAPTVLLLAYYWLMPESPRWLISKGRTDEAKLVLSKMAATNGKAFPERLFQEVVEEVKEEEREKESLAKSGERSSETLLTMFSHKRLAARLIVILWNWVANSLTFYGILLNVQNLHGSIYLNFLFACFVDFGGNLLSYFLVDRLGRKLTYCGFLLLAVTACLAAIFPSLYADKEVADTSLLILSLVGRFGISTAFNILYLYSAEMFPTTVRNSAMGMSSMTSRFGSVAAPYIADLGILIGGDLESALPLVVFGGAGLVAFLTTLTLPETNGQKLPNTIMEEISSFKKSDKESGLPDVTEMSAVQRSKNKWND